jgi:hypothetical protein
MASAAEFLDELHTPRAELIDALINQESGGNNSAVSSKGARGMAQVMPRTASNPGYGVKPLSSSHPDEQRRFATDYLGAMLKKYGGNERLALAAYNAGPGAVDAHGDVPPYPETQHYVKSILSALNPIKDANADESPYQVKSAADFLDAEDTPKQSAADFLDSGKQEHKWSDVPSEAISNLPSSAVKLAGGIANAVIHPVDTVLGLHSIASGAAQSLLPESLQPDSRLKDRQAASAAFDALKVRYGSEEALKNTLAHDPSGALMDVATVAMPVAGKLGMLKKATPAASIEAKSGGAAATRYAEQARAANIAPEVQQAIKDAELTGTLGEQAAKAHITAESLPEPVHLTAGQASGDVHQLSFENNMRGTPEGRPMADAFSAQNEALKKNLQIVHDQAAPDLYSVNHVDNGAAMIDALKTLHEERNNAVSAKYKALEDQNGGSFPVDGQKAAQNAIAALEKDDAFDSLPSIVTKKLNDYLGGKPMTYTNYERFRTILANESKKADGSIGSSRDGNAIHAIGLVRNSLEDLPLTGGAAHLKPYADAARAAAREHFQLIKDNPALEAAINSKIAPDDFVRKFIINGKVNDVSAMQDLLKANPEVAQTVSSGTIQHLMRKAGLDSDGRGTFSQAGYNKALEALRPKLSFLVSPQIAEHLENIGSTAFRHQYQPKGSYFNNSNTFVSGAASAAGGAALKSLDRMTFGVSGAAVDHLASVKLKNQVGKSLKAGAGVNSADLPLNKHK